MEARERKVINKSGLLGRTVTADYGHSSAYHTLRLDDRFSMMGVLEIWKKERTSGNAFVVITKRVKAQYWKNSLANFIRNDGTAATGIIEICKKYQKIS